tara:strand:- start:653 stop:1354 length:702 start_codon:yes stop_codon:yes gene_type:complete
MSEIPNKRIPEAKAPKIKYFRPASVEKADFRVNAAKAYKQRLDISIPRYSVIRSYEETTTIDPTIEKSINNENSNACTLFFLIYSKDISKHDAVVISSIAFTKLVNVSWTKRLLNKRVLSKGLFSTKRTPSNALNADIHAIGFTTIGYPCFTEVEYCTPTSSKVDTASKRNSSGSITFKLFSKNVVTFMFFFDFFLMITLRKIYQVILYPAGKIEFFEQKLFPFKEYFKSLLL